MVAELKKLKCGKIYEDVDLKKITSYKLKGKAKCVIIPNDQKGLINLFDYIKKNNLKYKIIGGGSNLIFDGDYDGILIRLDKFDHLKIEDTKIVVGAGYNLIRQM